MVASLSLKGYFFKSYHAIADVVSSFLGSFQLTSGSCSENLEAQTTTKNESVVVVWVWVIGG